MSNNDLFKILKKKEDGDSLKKRLLKLEKIITPKLDQIKVFFPEFPKHNIEHSKIIVRNLNLIIPEKLKKFFNIYEIYFRLASVFLHDIGMTLTEEDQSDGTIKELKKNKDKLKDFIRNNHHIRSEKYILNHYKELNIENEHEAIIIGKISKGHRKINLKDYDLKYSYKNYSINIALLSAFLRIGDELDLTFERITPLQDDSQFPENQLSKTIWETHLTIAGIIIDPLDPLTIKCNATCKDPDIHRKLKEWEIKVNDQLEELPNYLLNCKNEIPRKFKMVIEAINYKPYDFKFIIEDKQILTFLINKLYNKEEKAIREILKNSIDACRLRKQLLENEKKSYSPQISFILGKNQDTLIMEDNGIGMNEETFENFFTRIGKSFFSSDELKNSINFVPLSELGIGVLSYFLIANSVLIETKTDNNLALLVNIREIDKYFYVKESPRQETGTTITLSLKKKMSCKNYISDSEKQSIKLNYFEDDYSLDIKKVLDEYARHLNIPIKVKYEDFEWTINEKNFQFLLKHDSIFSFQIPFSETSYEGIIVLLGEFKEILNPKNLHDLGLIPFYQTITFQGILIDHENHLSFSTLSTLKNNWIIFDINIKKKILDLALNRDSLIINENYIKFSKEIESIILPKLPEFLYNYKEFLKSKKIEIEPQVRDFFHRFLMYPKDSSHLNLVKDYYFFKIVENNNIIYKSFSEILGIKDQLIILKNFEHRKRREILKILRKWHEYNSATKYLIYDYEIAPEIFKNLPVYEVQKGFMKKLS